MGRELQLSKQAFDQARHGIFQYGRKLEQLRFNHHFVEPMPEQVAAELATFQNPDGGFGHGIEPDFWLPDSSPMATTVGLQIAVELDLEASHPIVGAAMDYLLSTYDTELGGWIPTPLTVNNYPHAPWWHRDPNGSLDTSSLRINPGAEIVGYLLRWGHDDGQQWVQDLFKSIGTLESHEVLCCLRLLDTPGLLETDREALFEHVSRAMQSAIETNPDKWGGYCVKPLTAIAHPDARFAREFAHALDQQLDYEIAHQSQQLGVWLPHWSWGDFYPEAWQEARLAWSGIITLELLRSLQSFGRLQ